MATKAAIENFATSKTYAILFVMTEGLIEDMVATMDAIIEASDKPLSIIIVGVGNVKYDNFDELDGDLKDLKSHKGEMMKRGIVLFSHRKYNYNKFVTYGLILSI